MSSLLLTISKLSSIIIRTITKKANIDTLYITYIAILENISNELGLIFIKISDISM